jgi:hypothetical protein
LIDLDDVTSGVAKKITAQCHALKELNLDVDVIYMSDFGTKIWNIGSDKRKIIGPNKNKGMTFYSSVIKFLKVNAMTYDYAYVRLPYPSLKVFSFPLIYLFKNKFTKKLFIEIPTYPFFKESKSIKTFCYNTYLILSSLFFNKKIDIISYMGADRERIWGGKAVRVFNSVPLKNVPVKKYIAHEGVNFIGVAQLAYWHGYDRIQ